MSDMTFELEFSAARRDPRVFMDGEEVTRATTSVDLLPLGRVAVTLHSKDRDGVRRARIEDGQLAQEIVLGDWRLRG